VAPYSLIDAIDVSVEHNENCTDIERCRWDMSHMRNIKSKEIGKSKSRVIPVTGHGELL
jgi:hypothetical protein